MVSAKLHMAVGLNPILSPILEQVPMALSQMELPLTLSTNHTHLPNLLLFCVSGKISVPLIQEMPGSQILRYQLPFSLPSMDVSDQ